jgi:tryptophan-rich sensory protein
MKRGIMMEFLIQEYSQMFDEKRHYDNRLFSFVTMYFALLTISASVASFTYESLGRNIVLILTLIQALAGIVVVICLYKNRVSYVKACRQINSIRKFCLEKSCKDFLVQNIMPVDSGYPKFFKLDSLYFSVVIFIICINAICVGILTFCFYNNSIKAIVLLVLSLIIQFACNACFLIKRDKK